MAELTLTAKVKIELTAEQEAAVCATMNAYRDACNFVSEYVFRTHDLKMESLHEALYHTLRARFGLKSQMAQSVLKTVIARYKAIQTREKKWIRPFFRTPAYDAVFGRDYSLKAVHDEQTGEVTGAVLSLNALSGRIKSIPVITVAHEALFGDGMKLGTMQVVHKHGKFFAHIPVTITVPDCSADREALDSGAMVVGVDRGLNFLMVTCDENLKSMFFPGGEVKQKRAKFKETREELQSKGTSSARHRLKGVGGRESRWMSDVNHCLSKTLVDAYPPGTIYVLEDLSGIRKALEAVRLKDRYEMVSWAYYDLEQKLKYKAARKGQTVILVDPAYTSQTCPRCGHTERSNRKRKTHSFECRNCGYRSNDDRVAAINLCIRGIVSVCTGERI